MAIQNRGLRSARRPMAGGARRAHRHHGMNEVYREVWCQYMYVGSVVRPRVMHGVGVEYDTHGTHDRTKNHCSCIDIYSSRIQQQ